MNEENEKIRISKASFREWLEKLQQESWQLELLISGFALFAVWEARVLVDSFEVFYDLHRGSDQLTGVFATAFSWLLTIGWRIFFFNLLIHVLSRGLWIGAIGLRYVSSDIDYDSFDYAPIFDRFLRKNVGDFDDYIEGLERFSSVLFAYTFLLFFIFFSLVLYFVELGFIFNLFGGTGIGIILFFAFLFLGLFAFIDFVTMGGIKKIKQKNIARIYFVLYRIFSFLTLSFLYRPLLYNFWDEKYTRRLFLVSIPYMILLTLLPKIESDATPFFPNYDHGDAYGHELLDQIDQASYNSFYYDDERASVQERKEGVFRKRQIIKGISLPSMELTGNYGSFFLRSYPNDARWLEEERGIIPFKKKGFTIRNWKDMRTDSLYKTVQQKGTEARVASIKNRQALSKQLRAGEITQLVQGVLQKNDQFELDSLYWEQQKDSINTYWSKESNQYLKDKLQKLNNSILELATITIDGIPYNDSCDCKLYIHPNAGEKGLRCYFPMKNLEEGPHLLYLQRKAFYGREKDREGTNHYYVPFYKIDKDF